MFDVSIIIINYNTLKMTDECICSVIEKTSGISYEIILVDNASTDGSKEFFSNDSRVKYIYNNENLGFGRANDKGIEIAEGRNILFLNSDTLLRNNAVKILSDYLDNNEKVGACGGNLFDQYGKPNHSYYRRLPSIFYYYFGANYYRFGFGRNWEFNYSGKEINVGHITGADLMIRKSLLDEVGGFNHRFFMYFEETELCYRIKHSEYKIMSVPGAEIIHFKKTAPSTTALKYYDKSFATYLSLTCNRTQMWICKLMFKWKCNSPINSTRIRWQKFRTLFYDTAGSKSM